MEIILNTKEKPNIDEILEFIKNLSEEEQKKIINFVQGIRFAKTVSEAEAEQIGGETVGD